MAMFNSYNYDSGSKAILITPQLAMPSDKFEVRFWMHRDNEFPWITDLVNVYYNTLPAASGGVLLGTINRNTGLPPVVAQVKNWYEYAFSMPSGSSGNAYIIFEGVSAFGNNIFLDDIKVQSSCLVESFPFNESFDLAAFAPSCWSNKKTAGTSLPGTWDRQTAGVNPTCAPHSGAAMARFNSWDYSSGTKAILATPMISMPSDQFEVSFWMYREVVSGMEIRIC